MKIEWWKFIPGYDCRYMVSNKGRVLSLNYNKTGIPRLLSINIFKGYNRVGLTQNGKPKWNFVHRLVAAAFLPNPNNLPCVNHKNEIKTDNRVENIEWCSYSYNINYGARNEKTGEKLRNNNRRSKPVIQYTPKGEYITTFKSIREAERQTGVNQSFIMKCCKGLYEFACVKGGPRYKWSYAYSS